MLLYHTFCTIARGEALEKGNESVIKKQKVSRLCAIAQGRARSFVNITKCIKMS